MAVILYPVLPRKKLTVAVYLCARGVTGTVRPAPMKITKFSSIGAKECLKAVENVKNARAVVSNFLHILLKQKHLMYS